MAYDRTSSRDSRQERLALTRFSSGGRGGFIILRGAWGRAVDRFLVRWTGWSMITWQYTRAAGRAYQPTLLLTTIGRRTGLLRSSRAPVLPGGHRSRRLRDPGRRSPQPAVGRQRSGKSPVLVTGSATPHPRRSPGRGRRGTGGALRTSCPATWWPAPVPEAGGYLRPGDPPGHVDAPRQLTCLVRTTGAQVSWSTAVGHADAVGRQHARRGVSSQLHGLRPPVRSTGKTSPMIPALMSDAQNSDVVSGAYSAFKTGL